jgi:hypothetical protein
MVLADHLVDQIGGIAADLRNRGKTLQSKAVVALDRQRYVHAPNVVEREGGIEEAQERTERTARIVAPMGETR